MEVTRRPLARWVCVLLGYVLASYVVCAFAFLRGGAPHGNDGLFVVIWLASPIVSGLFFGTIIFTGLTHFEEWGTMVAVFLAIWLAAYVLLRCVRRRVSFEQAPAAVEGIQRGS